MESRTCTDNGASGCASEHVLVKQRLDSVSGLAMMENNDMQNAAIMPAMSGPIEWLRFMEGIEQIGE